MNGIRRLVRQVVCIVPILIGLAASGCYQGIRVSPNVAEIQQATKSSKKASVKKPMKGWGYLAGKLKKDGINDGLVERVYLSPNMPSFNQVPFSLKPAETHGMYRQFTNERYLKLARDTYNQHQSLFQEVGVKYNVDGAVIAAILYVETKFGKHTGNEIVINRLSRLANIAEPDNVKWNYNRLKKEDPKVTLQSVRDRAKYLEDTFYPEVLVLFQLASQRKIDLIKLKGSIAGAFGMPQFLPSSYMRHAVDGNNDGVISLFDLEDAVYSVGSFLSFYGWDDNLPVEGKLKVLWFYNHSRPYGMTILRVAESFK